MRVPLDYARDGVIVATGDGPELLVWDARKDDPLWKHFGDGILVGVGVNEEHLVTVDSDGRVEFFRRLDGALQERHELGDGLIRALQVSEGARVGVLGKDAIHVVQLQGLERTIPVPDAVVLAFGPGGGSLGVGTAAGVFWAVDPASGGAWGTVDVGAAVRGVAWSPAGYWWVAAGDALIAVAGDGSAELRRFAVGEPVLGLAVSRDGVVAVVPHPSQRLSVWALAEGAACGQVGFQRPVGDVRFGPGSWIAVGFDDGEVNRVDLLYNKVTLPDPHLGRRASRWAVDAKVRPELLRGAIAKAAAGGAPLVTRVKHAWDIPRPKRQITIGDPDVPGCGCWQMAGCMLTLTIIVLLFIGVITGYWWYFDGAGPLGDYLPF